MSAILKSGAAMPPRVAAETVTRPSPVQEAMEAMAAKLARLEGQLAAKDQEIDDLRAEVITSFEQGKVEGRELGKTEAEDGEAHRLAVIEKSLAAALKSHAEALHSTERLAAMLAHDTLDLLFSDATHRAEWIGAILKSQLEKIDQLSVIEIAVSAQDFSDAGVAALSASLGTRRLAVVRDADMASGDCIIRQRLGEVDVGLRTQWSSLSGLLAGMASTVDLLG